MCLLMHKYRLINQQQVQIFPVSKAFQVYILTVLFKFAWDLDQNFSTFLFIISIIYISNSSALSFFKTPVAPPASKMKTLNDGIHKNELDIDILKSIYNHIMAEILSYNPEDNPRLNEIYEILLLAGYFRIRIASLKAFDKVTGGIAWCITSSNFQVEIEYNDEMQIGQKIKVSEVICNALQQIKCPHSLQPFQLQGLDVNGIFPVVQWLVKFVYETREQRQKYDRSLSLLLGKQITKLEPEGNPEKVQKLPIKRARINKAISQISYNHPVRVYSALLQYKDASANKMYNKLLNIITKKVKKKGDKKQKNKEMIGYFEEEEEEQSSKEMNEFGNVGNLSLERLQRIIEENKENLEEGIKEVEPEEELQIPSKVGVEEGQKTAKQKSPKKQQTRQKQRIIKNMKKTNEKIQQQILALENQVISYENMQKKVQEELEEVQEKHEKAREKAVEEIETNKEYKAIGRQIQEDLKTKKETKNQKLQKLVEKRITLKTKKTDLKKKAKLKIQQLNNEKQLVEASIPEIDEEAFHQMMEEAETKKQIFDKKYQQLTMVNQELAILQRKAENITSPAEIVQYHQRFIELFESINILIEEKRNMYSEMQNLESEKKVVMNYLQVVKNTKEEYMNCKKKNELRELLEEMKDIVNGLDENMKGSESTVDKVRSQRQGVYEELLGLIKLERQYLQLLRDLKVEYENASKYYK